MDLQDVSEELRTVLGTITGLRVPVWGAKAIQPPAAIVALPETIDFDETYGRGKDRYPDLSIVLLVGAPTERSAVRTMAAFADGSGAKSIKAVLEAHTPVAYESLRVTRAEFDTPRYAGTDYLAAVFHLDIIGRGA